MNKKVILIASGGMDSTTLAYSLKNQGYELYLLSFNYGQRHLKELAFASRCAMRLTEQTKFTKVDLTAITPLLKGSALTEKSVLVPEGHYEDEMMKATIVPNRNAIMLSIAYGLAVSQKIDTVAIGVHAGDHAIYPDCRPQFIKAFEQMERVATDRNIKLVAPFANMTKAQIVAIGNELGVPFADTWSCYKGGELHCGKCGTCIERIEAFQLAGVLDPTEYRK